MIILQTFVPHCVVLQILALLYIIYCAQELRKIK